MIEEIECRVPEGAAGIVCEPWAGKQAATGHAMRWSLPAVVAARVADGAVGMSTFEGDISREARALARRTRWTPLQDADFPSRFEAEIHCRLRNGEERTIRVDDAYGNRSRPASAERVMEKFRDNLAVVGGGDAVGRIADAVEALDTAPDLDELGAALRSAAPR
jgi:2-methylcitrate dehydratase PrpD